MSRLRAALAAFFLCCLAVPAAHAVDDDTRFLLDRVRRAAERQSEAPAEPVAPPGSVRHEGRLYAVGDTLQDLETALYIALNTGQWERLVEFVERYRALPGHRPALVAMAEGLLARQAGDYRRALPRMQAAHAAEPEDLRIRLELARLQFEDNQDRQARAGFEGLLAGELPEHARGLIGQYLQALDQRADWHGSVALGLGRNDNINQANGAYTCLLKFEGMCIFERRMPEAIGSNLFNYDLALQRRIALGGHHNLQLRVVGYGSQFWRQSEDPNIPVHDYSAHTAIAYVGYQYLNARDSFTASPYLEYHLRNSRGEYAAPGLQLEWRRRLNSRWQIGSLLDAKRHQFTDWGERVSRDFSQYQWSLFASYAPQANTSLYGGVDLVRKKYPVAQASTREAALRAGVFHVFPGKAGVYVNALGIFRLANADAYDGFLGARRHDRQQVYILTAGVNALKIAGMTPELRIRRSVDKADPYWAFGFEQNEIGFMLRRNF